MGARRWSVAAAVLVVLLGGLVVADRVAVRSAQAVAEREVVAGFEDVLGEPEVLISGFPFLTQLVAGTLTEVTASVAGLTLDGLEVTDVDLAATGVSTTEPYTVDSAELVATLPVVTLQQLIAAQVGLELDLTVDGDRLRAGTTLLGLEVAAGLAPKVEDADLRVDIVSVSFGGVEVDAVDLPGRLEARLTDLSIPVEGLPPGVVLTEVAVHDGGVQLTATGTDVVLSADGLG